MCEPRHSQKYYDAVTPEGLPAHYNRKNWENRETFVNVTRKNVLRSNVLANKGWIKGAYTNFKSPNQRKFHADHQVAIKEAWQSGGFQWTSAQKKKFAHDVSNIVMSERQTNIAKGYKGPNKWLPLHNVSRYLLRREATKKKYNLTSNKAEVTAFQKEIGRKPNVNIGPKVEKTKYCATCHINHSAGKHR